MGRLHPAVTGAADIKCPACKSEISSDGATLRKRSTYLEELIETDAGVDDLEKTIGTLEQKLAEAKQEIARLKASPAPAPATQPTEKKEVKKNASVGEQGSGRKTGSGNRDNWW